MAFVLRNLHKVQNGRGVNAPGTPEIPVAVFEELLVNALVHRDYLVNAPVRLFIFANRIEILSPGHLPDNLSVAKIRTGNSNLRNPILASYVAKGLLPYRGLGSGVKRALAAWPEIEFANDRDGCLFTVTIQRKSMVVSEKSSEKSSEKILNMLHEDPELATRDVSTLLGISTRAVEKQLQKLKEQGRLRRLGPDKGGRWEVT